MDNKLINRFLKYVSIDTQSDETKKNCPSTEKQWELANLLFSELTELGLQDIAIDKNAYVTATLPSNTDKDTPVVGFISHMDTSPDMSGKDVKPRIIHNYQGQDIILDEPAGIILKTSEFPELLRYIGQDLITTNGTTLLGADDKAGIAEIVTAMEYLIQHPEIKHGTIKIGFTPDEEIGRGADLFDVKSFNADFAYTVDGGQIGELEYENFNAALASIQIQGRNVHPGTAKDQMINALLLGMELNMMLPPHQRPGHTEGYEGFFHLIDFHGTVESVGMRYIIRDHDWDKFEGKKKLIQETVNFLNLKHGDRYTLVLQDQYFNMKEKIEPVRYIVDIAEQAMKEVGVSVIKKPIRGGTDGSKLSFMGLPCPNIFAGGHNFHGKYEYIPVQSMEKSVRVIVKICELVAKVEVKSPKAI
ncbi:MAG: peptidase T [Cyclobacteriaceae bacterium]|nr:peptidase T [Cyclobacteriaceae bacterium]